MKQAGSVPFFWCRRPLERAPAPGRPPKPSRARRRPTGPPVVGNNFCRGLEMCELVRPHWLDFEVSKRRGERTKKKQLVGPRSSPNPVLLLLPTDRPTKSFSGGRTDRPRCRLDRTSLGCCHSPLARSPYLVFSLRTDGRSECFVCLWTFSKSVDL